MPCQKLDLQVTERLNELTDDLDACNALEFVRSLRAAEAQIFTGWRGFPSLLDEPVLRAADCVSQAIADMILADLRCSKRSRFIFSGCGTSGRIAFLVARRFNQILDRTRVQRCHFDYLISGGDSALLLSNEFPEDDPIQGAADLKQLIDSPDVSSVFVGISCGLSAPYVAGQLDAAMTMAEASRNAGAETMSRSRHVISVLGFNPIELARDVHIEKWPGGKSFRDVVCELHAREVSGHSDCSVINPIIGPEPIQGSSRMKGGSATALLLDAICCSALERAGVVKIRTSRSENAGHFTAMCDLLATYQQSYGPALINAMPGLSRVMDLAAEALRSGGNLYYLGTGAVGCLGFIDASEMPDTFGSSFDETRAFVEGSWISVGNRDGDLSAMSKLHRIGLNHFEHDIVPILSAMDAVVVLAVDSVEGAGLSTDLMRTVSLVVSKVGASRVGAIACSTGNEHGTLKELLDISHDRTAHVKLASLGLLVNPITGEDLGHDGLASLSFKFMLNAVSTFAQAVGKGSVFMGRMITTGPTNDKIYERCVRLVADICGIPVQAATDALHRAIHKVDVLPDELKNVPISKHIIAATPTGNDMHKTQKTLPLAFLLGSGCWTVAAAQKALESEPRVRVLLQTMQRSGGTCDFSRPLDQGIAHNSYALGVDLGGTNVRVAIVDTLTGMYAGPVLRATIGSARSPEAVMELTYKLCIEALEKSEVRDKVSAIGVASPGKVHASQGAISSLAAFPNWNTPVPFGAFLSDKLRLPVNLSEDADAALTAEVLVGAAKGCSSAVLLTIGTGVGTATWLNGEMYVGNRGLVEGGHAIFVPEGRECACGQQGCLEAYSSGSAITSRAQEIGLKIETCEHLFSLAEAGDEKAMNLLDEATATLAIAILNLCRYFDPEVVVLSGGLANHFWPRCERQLRKLQWKLHDDAKDIDIKLAMCEEPGVVGAGVLAAMQFGRATCSKQWASSSECDRQPRKRLRM